MYILKTSIWKGGTVEINAYVIKMSKHTTGNERIIRIWGSKYNLQNLQETGLNDGFFS